MENVTIKHDGERKIVITDVGISIHQPDGRILNEEIIFCETRGLDIIDQRNNGTVVYQPLGEKV